MPVGVGVGGGAEGVMVAVRTAGDVEGSGVNVPVEYAISNGVVALSTHPVGRGTVTIRPVGSTVGNTAGSLEVTLKDVPAGNAAPTGERVPVKTSVFPPTVASPIMISLKRIAVGVLGSSSSSMRFSVWRISSKSSSSLLLLWQNKLISA